MLYMACTIIPTLGEEFLTLDLPYLTYVETAFNSERIEIIESNQQDWH